HASKIENSSDHTLLTTTGVSVGRVDFNTEVEPLGNRKVRRALAWAVDKQQIVDTVLQNYGKPAKSVLPSSFPDYNDDISDYNHPSGDPDQAKSLLEEAGHSDLSVELLVPTRERHEQQATLLQSMFDEIGVDVTINTMEGNAMWSNEVEGNFEVAISNFTWFGDPDTLVYLFHSEGLNLWNIGDSELDSLLEDQRSTVDQQERSQLLADIQKHIYEEAYSVFTYYPDRIQGIASAIENFEQYPNGSFRSLKDAQVNQ
ncbi:MAG: ABC transporter substrate-binding protein, partial [Halobacteriales archaeon]